MKKSVRTLHNEVSSFCSVLDTWGLYIPKLGTKKIRPDDHFVIAALLLKK